MKKYAGVGRAMGVIILGALIGGVLGELFGFVLPEGVVKEFFTRAAEVGFSQPLAIDLKIIAFSFSFLLRVNIVSVIGMGFGYYFLRYTR